VKPCDSRAINIHLSEGHYAREDVFVLGISCEGVLEGAGYSSEPGENLQSRCVSCELSEPVLSDALIGEPSSRSSPQNGSKLETHEPESPDERLNFWLSEFDRCIRCYACRQACPMCQCPTCLFEREDAIWVGMAHRLPEKRMFHLGRAFHLAGRCIECDACQQACPMDIPIRLLNQKLAEVMEETFGYRPGFERGAPPLVTILRGEEVVE
jgi:ferredoxin